MIRVAAMVKLPAGAFMTCVMDAELAVKLALAS
jgi:hypothetical protein